MKLGGRIDERAFEHVLVAPATAPAEFTARLELVERALIALETVCVPLALEVERARVSLDTGLFREPPPEPPVLLYVENQPPAHVALLPTVAEPPRAIRAPLDAKNVRAMIAASAGAKAGDTISDWRRIEALATAARARSGASTLALAQLPKHPVPAQLRRGLPWFAGPLDAEGWRRFPPIAFRFDAEGGVVRLRLIARWAPWSEAGTEERALFEETLAALRGARFVPDR